MRPTILAPSIPLVLALTLQSAVATSPIDSNDLTSPRLGHQTESEGLAPLSLIHSKRSSTTVSAHSLWRRWRKGRIGTKAAVKVLARDGPEEGYYDPRDGGGSMLTIIPVTYPMGQGEPANVIIAGNSDADVLKIGDEGGGGLLTYFESFGFSGECLGQHSGSDQAMDLGDGNGAKNETAVMRWNYGDPQLGTCTETVKGGNHFRYWVQNGKERNSGAIFLAVSYELPIAQGHDIIQNGYNLGRDWLIGNITTSSLPPAPSSSTTPPSTSTSPPPSTDSSSASATDSSTSSTSSSSPLPTPSSYTGTTSARGYTYSSSITYVQGLLPDTNDGINHNATVGVQDVVNASDGWVAVVKVSVVGRPEGAAWRNGVSGMAVVMGVVAVLFSAL